MSKCFRDASRQSVRGNGPGSAAAVAKKKPSSQSIPFTKRKVRSIGSAASSNVRAVSSDAKTSTENEKNTPGSVVTAGHKSQEHEKDTKIPQKCQNMKVDSVLEQKRREFLIFRKEFIEHQNAYIDQYAKLRDLEAGAGVTAGPASGEVHLLSITDWPVHDLLLMAESAPTQQHIEIKGTLGPKILQQLTVQLSGIREQVLAMGTELMRRRLEILKFIRAIQRNENRVFVYEGNNIEWQTKNAEFDNETSKLRELVLATVKDVEAKLTHTLDAAKIPWMDRDNLIKKIERLQKELSTCKIGKPSDPVKTEKSNDNKKMLEELHKERAVRASLKDMLAAAEEKVATAHARIAELERQLSASTSRSKWAPAQNIKQMHSNCRGSSHDSVTKKLPEKYSKKSEVSVEVLSRQRDILQLRVAELQEEAAVTLQEAEKREAQLISRVDSLLTKMEDQEKQKELLERRAVDIEKRFTNLQEQYNKLQGHSRDLLEAQSLKCLDYLPRKVQCSSKDYEILFDLQATKDALSRASVELEQSRADKDELVKTFAEIAQERSDNGMAGQLLQKEQAITALRRQNEELTENNKMLKQSLKCFENQITSLRSEVSLLRNFNEYKSCNLEVPHEELEKQVFDLCLRVERLTREREELASEAATRALMLERHERCAELFAQVTRARRELVAHLKGTTNAQTLLDSVSEPEVSTLMSKAYLSSANTWSALRAERERVLRLEGIVHAQTQQLERESHLRVKQDRRRAQLERELIRSWATSGELFDSKQIKENETSTSDSLCVMYRGSRGNPPS